MHELKAGLNTDKFATFRRFPKNVYQSFGLQLSDLYKGRNSI